MSLASSRLIACVSRCQTRHRSTTSAIKAGLRAEQTTKVEARWSRDNPRSDAKGRERVGADRNPRRDVNQSLTRSKNRFEQREDRSVQRRFRTDRALSGTRDKLPELDEPRGRHASRTDRASRGNSHGAAVEGEAMTRKERRAKFWEENKPSEDEDDLEQLTPARHLRADQRTQRSQSRLALQEDLLKQPVQRRARTESQDGRFGTSNRDRRSTSRQNDREEDDDSIPQRIPYTTASSQFIYGGNMVLATLLAGQRKFYRLYVSNSSHPPNLAQILSLATDKKIKITQGADTSLLDAMSKYRPHNGIVLETSAMPAIPAVRLDKARGPGAYYVLVAPAEGANNNNMSVQKRALHPKPSQPPFVLFLDGVTDPGNVGNIIRSAYFLGADAVAFNNRTCCAVDSPILAKASAGACEAIPLLSVSSAGDFISQSRRYGWTVCAAVAPAGDQASFEGDRKQRLTPLDIIQSPTVSHKPCILMLGGEGEGLPSYLQKSADIFVTIARAPLAEASKGDRASHRLDKDVGVDSMNVGSAAALLISAFKDSVRLNPLPASRDSKGSSPTVVRKGMMPIDGVKPVESHENASEMPSESSPNGTSIESPTSDDTTENQSTLGF